MAHGETDSILLRVIAVACGSTSHDVSVFVSFFKPVPEAVNVDAIHVVCSFDSRRTSESADCLRWVTADDVLVVAVVLGEGFLEDGSPDCSIRANAGVLGLAICVKGQVIIDDDCVRDAEGVEVDSVDTHRVDFVHIVEEDLFHATRVLRDG